MSETKILTLSNLEVHVIRHIILFAAFFFCLSQLEAKIERSSYILVLNESSTRYKESINSYSLRLQKDLEYKIEQLKLDRSLLQNLQTEDKLWISQSIRLDLNQNQVKDFSNNPMVLAVIQDNEIYLEQPIIENTKEVNNQKITYGLESIDVQEVWEKYKFLGQGITVGIIDTGWAQHPDLVGKVLRSKDFVSEFKENEPNDDRGHGTHCMGTIGGGNESGKAIGVAPKVKFVVAKIFDYEGKAYRSGILKAMQWMTNPDGDISTNDFPRVISNSWGKKFEGYENENEIDYIRASEVWRQFEIAPVFAAGNSGPSDNTIASPSALKTNFSVAAIDEKDKIGTFSSRGVVRWKDGVILTKPNVSAPGVKVYSSTRNGSYASWSGTSMACPHVAGVIALMLQANPNLTVTEIFSILEQSAYELGEPGWDKAYGYGKISALRAVEIALNLSYLSLNIGTQSSLVRMTDSKTGQVYRFESGKPNTLYLKNGSYSFTLQSFGSVDQKLEVDLSRGETVSVVTKLEKAPTATWVLNIVSEKNRPMNANLQFFDVPIQQENIGKDGIELELPQSIYKYALTAYGYNKISGRLKLDQNKRSFIKMKPLKDVLIVNATRDETLTNYIESSIPRGYRSDYTNRLNTMTLEKLQKYKRVLWFTGEEKWGALPYAKREILIDYYNAGGTVILTGQNNRDVLESSDFTEELFGVRVTRPKSSQKRLKGLGLGMLLNAGSSARNQDSPEEIMTTSSDAEIILSYMNNQGAMSERKSGRSRAYYLGFGLEGLSALDRTRLNEIIFERSKTSLLVELKRAQKLKDSNQRMQIIHASRKLIPKTRTELNQSLKILKSMGLENSYMFNRLRAFDRFERVHQ